MRFVYARVSSKDQHLDRQIEEIKKIFPDIEEQNIYSDKQSGKDFNRTNYQKLKEIVSSGDEIIIKELDRLGRNKDEIKKELAWFKEKKVICRILDVPTTLIDFKDQDWLFDMINNVMIEVMGAIAEQERKKMSENGLMTIRLTVSHTILTASSLCLIVSLCTTLLMSIM